MADTLIAADRVYAMAYKHYERGFTAYVESLTLGGTSHDFNLEAYLSTEADMTEAVSGLFSYFTDYHVHLKTRTTELLGDDAPSCDDYIEAINRCLTAFEKNLGDLSNMTLKLPEFKSLFFSLGHYLSTLSERYRQEHASCFSTGFFGLSFSKASRPKEINFVQVVASHDSCTDNIRLNLILNLRDKIMKEKFGKNSRLAELLHEAIAHTLPMEAPGAIDLLCINELLGLQNLSIPHEFKAFLQSKQGEEAGSHHAAP